MKKEKRTFSKSEIQDRTDHKLVYASGGHPPALLFSGCDSKQFQIEQLRTPNFIMGGREGVSYQKKVQEIRRPSRLYVFTDGVYDITRTDGSIWGFNGLLEFSAQAFNADHSNLDCLLGYAQELAQKEEFEDDFTILEVVFE